MSRKREIHYGMHRAYLPLEIPCGDDPTAPSPLVASNSPTARPSEVHTMTHLGFDVKPRDIREERSRVLMELLGSGERATLHVRHWVRITHVPHSFLTHPGVNLSPESIHIYPPLPPSQFWRSFGPHITIGAVFMDFLARHQIPAAIVPISVILFVSSNRDI